MWRNILYKIHLWLGIISGVILFIVCLSGTLLVFRLETIMFFEHNKYFVSHPNQSPLNTDELIAKVEKNMNGKVSAIITRNCNNNAAYFMCIETENNTKTNHHHNDEEHFRGKPYLIDPYTGETLGTFLSPLNICLSIIARIHRSLFIPAPFGRIIVGSATLIFVIISLSGFCLWLPANLRNKRAWKNGLTIRFHKGKNQLISDLHKTLGFYVLIPVLIMTLTGLAWSFKWYSNGIQMIFHDQHFRIFREPSIKSPPQNPDAKRLPYDFFVKKADELIEHKGMRNFYIPEHEDGVIIVLEKRLGTLQLAVWDKIQFDQYTGEVLKIERFKDLPAGSKFVSLFLQLHTGDIIGLPTKIIYLIASLIATTLPITGTIIWLRKLRHLRKTKDKLNAV
ncbi:MAG: PepSY domain-containing protein [Planctomycetaceae bacterium]|nr:PepSY domain-containing protein [Planctomycetaceae bacterium]